MKDIEIFDLLAPESLEILKRINPKFKKLSKFKSADIRKALSENDVEIEEIFNDLGIKKNLKKLIQVSDWVSYAYHEAYLNNAEKINKGHLFFSFLLLYDVEKYYHAKKVLLAKAGLDVDLSDQSFVQDLTEVAKKISQPFIGRDKEMTRLIVNLSSQNEDRPTLLLGESGTGKTSIMLELANRINLGLVPANLLGTKVLRVKFGMLVNLIALEKPGVQGDFFSRLIGDILSNAKYKGKVVLFLDDLRIGMNFLITFGPINKKSGITIVGAAQNDINEKFWESPVAKSWNVIALDEQSDIDVLNILNNYAQMIQSKGNILYKDEAISKILDLYKLGFIDEGMPGGGIKLLEQLAIYKRHKDYNYDNLSKQIKTLSNSQSTASANTEVLEKAIDEMVSIPVIIDDSDVVSYVDMSDIDGSKKELVFDSKKLLGLESSLKEEIIGQDKAIESIGRSLRVSSLKLSGDSRPIGALLFLGPTGVGKTETAKVLAKYLFGFRDKNKKQPNNFYRADLSEYGEKHTISKLFGAPPGYVGYEDSSSLTDYVNENPNAVVLFDEIDKAHPDVLNSLLHIMDEGEIRNNKGEIVSFENVIIIMTSNHGAELINRSEIGFNKSNEGWRDNVMENLKEKLKPEFINRFDEIILFDKLDNNAVEKIAKIHIDALIVKLAAINIKLKIGKGLIAKLMKEANTAEYGARDLKRVIKKEIMDPLSKILLEKSAITEISVGIKGVTSK